jgi:prevent-host-death family protein
MVSIGVREFKAGLSRHLRRAQAGTHIAITDRGRAIAVLSPATPAPNLDWLRKMVAKGEATWSGGKPQGLNPRIPTRGKPGSQQIIEDRR